MRFSPASRISWAAILLLASTATLAIFHRELAAAEPYTLIDTVEIGLAVLTFLSFLPALAARFYEHRGDPAVPAADRVFAAIIEAGMYGMMLILPIAIWSSASLVGAPVAAFGFHPPTLLASSEKPPVPAITNVQLFAAVALVLVVLHFRSRGIAMLALAARAVNKKHGRSRSP